MLRRKLPKKAVPISREAIAEYFNITIDNVIPEKQEDTYSINLSDKDSQSLYRLCNPWGNTTRPKIFDFSVPLLVRWTGQSVKPC